MMIGKLGGISFLFALMATRNTWAQIVSEQCTQCIDVDIYFHAIAYDNGTFGFIDAPIDLEGISPMIQQGMDVLNNNFNNTPFKFIWRNQGNISTTNNTLWTTATCNALGAKTLGNWRFLGDPTAINVYLGHQTHQRYPRNTGCGSFPSDEYNGIGMNYEILPPLGNGLTLAHEVGHWMGLLHTYSTSSNFGQFEVCDPRLAGDFVDDTPLQTKFDSEMYTNQTTWDSCPDVPGEDAFFNIMNRVCFRRVCFGNRGYFTRGQIERMYLNWLFIRKFNEECGTRGRLLDLKIRLLAKDQTLYIFDSKGKEVFNLVKYWNVFNFKFRSDMCLLKDETYFVLFLSRNARSRHKFSYSVDGDVVLTGSKRLFVAGNLSTFSLLPSNSTASEPSPMFSSLIRQNITMNDCNSTEAFLQVRVIDGEYKWLGLFDTTGQGTYLSSSDACITRGFPYILLAGFNFSDASQFQVYVDGIQINSVDGPFHKTYFTYPHVVSTFIPSNLSGINNTVSSSPTMSPVQALVEPNLGDELLAVSIPDPMETLAPTVAPANSSGSGLCTGAGYCWFIGIGSILASVFISYSFLRLLTN